VKPFPWPSKQEDIGAASAAVLLNLLLVYAFMAPTRAVVGSIVREKELRLREGMRILGLSVSRSLDVFGLCGFPVSMQWVCAPCGSVHGQLLLLLLRW
jgi:hypothetical protein